FFYEFTASHFVNCPLEICRQGANTSLLSLFLCQMEDVRVSRLPRVDLILYPINSSSEHKGKSKIWVTGRVRASQFYSCPIASGRRNTNQGASILCRPGDINRCFISGHNSLIGVNNRICDCCKFLYVFQ